MTSGGTGTYTITESDVPLEQLAGHGWHADNLNYLDPAGALDDSVRNAYVACKTCRMKG